MQGITHGELVRLPLSDARLRLTMVTFEDGVVLPMVERMVTPDFALGKSTISKLKFPATETPCLSFSASSKAALKDMNCSRSLCLGVR